MSRHANSEWSVAHAVFSQPSTLPMIGYAQRGWAVMIILAALIGSFTLEVAAQEVDPGSTNPVTPSARLTMFPDQHALMAMPENPITGEGLVTYTDWVRNPNLQSMDFQNVFEPDLKGLTQARGASGHIVNQKEEHTAVAKYNGSGRVQAIVVDLLTPSGDLDLTATSEITPAFATSQQFPQIPMPNSYDVAVGNLSQLVDENGIGHDEVAVCYPTGPANPSRIAPALKVKVTVLDYTNLTEAGVNQTTAEAPVEFNTSQSQTFQNRLLLQGMSDSIISCATGDANGDGIDEVILAFVDSPITMWVGVFAYTNDGENQPTLEQVGSGVVLRYLKNPTLPDFINPEFFSSVDVVTGDFNGDGRMDIGVSNISWSRKDGQIGSYPGIYVLSSDLAFNLTLESTYSGFQPGFTSQSEWDQTNGTGSYGCRPYNGVQPVSSTQACETMRATMVAGLFKFNPSIGFTFDRRQLGVVYNMPFAQGGGLRALTLEVSDDLQTITPLGEAVTLPQQACPEGQSLCPSSNRFSVGIGGFIGATDINNPRWSLMVSNWEATLNGSADGTAAGQFHAFWLQSIPEDGSGGTGGSLQLVWDAVLLDAQDITGIQNARLPLVAWDREGASVYLGAPVQMTVYNLIRADYIIGEPPKHIYWWPPSATTLEEGQVINVSRDDDFFVELTDSEELDYSITNTDVTDWSIGGSLSASSKGSVEIGANVGIVKTSATGSIEVSGKIGYDYDENKSSYEKDYRSETRKFEGMTTRGDLIRAQLQTFDIWRYPVSGVPLDDGLNAFWEISFPGEPVNASGGGLGFSGYTPSYENGNILSYPIFQNNTYNPPDCCAEFTFLENGQEVTRSMPFLNNERLAFDETSIVLDLKFSESSGSGEEKTYENKLSESAEIQIGFKTETKIFGGKAKTETKASANLNNSNSWSNVTSSDSTTNTSTGFTLSKPAGNPSQTYFFLPVFYLAEDGTTKVKHAVDILGAGRPFWTKIYGQLPDAALKLPRRFDPVEDSRGNTIWVPNESDDRKEIRGFFTRFEEPDQAGTFPLTPGAVDEGTRVRLEVEVHNYSLSKNLSGLPIVFEAAPYDSLTNTEGPRVPLVCEAGSILFLSLNPLERKRARCVWDTTGFGPGIPAAKQEYRMYVTLDPDNQIVELYEGTEGPGQNNQGWALFEVADPELTFRVPTPTAEVPNGADVHLDTVAIALEVEGKLETSFARVTRGQRTPLRVCVETDQTQTGYHHVLIYDGNPERGGTLIQDALLPGIERGNPTCIWKTDFRFETPGHHRLFAQVLETRIDGKAGNAVDTLRVRVSPQPVVQPTLDQGAATGLTTDDGQGRFEISGTFRYFGNVNLNASTLIFGEVLDELGGTGELIPGVDALTGQPLVLFAKDPLDPIDEAVRNLPVRERYEVLSFFKIGKTFPLITKIRALLNGFFRELRRVDEPFRETTVVFETLGGQDPHVQVKIRQQRFSMEVNMVVENAEILQPSQCGPLRSTQLTTSLLLMDNANPPVELIFEKERWSCQINADGEVTALELPRG